jgi:hypothetical protein
VGPDPPARNHRRLGLGPNSGLREIANERSREQL